MVSPLSSGTDDMQLSMIASNRLATAGRMRGNRADHGPRRLRAANPRWICLSVLGLLVGWLGQRCVAEGAKTIDPAYGLFSRSNLVAWCIVPFDAGKRGPEARAAMLNKLGITMLAYDYRAEHIPSFDQEMESLKKARIRLLAWWFPGALNDEARVILRVLRRHEMRGVQLWVSGGGESTRTAEEQAARVRTEADRIQPIADAAREIGSQVALYNHGGWFGEPPNQIAIIRLLRERGVTNVGLVYNLHHGHDHLDRFGQLLTQMKPYLLALNLNGMTRDGEKTGKKILVLGQGDLDLRLLSLIQASGWTGPIGILNHTEEDAEKRLAENLAGLDQLVRKLPAGATASPGIPAGETNKYWTIEDANERERLPLYQVIPPATTDELTLADKGRDFRSYTTWERSHGDNGGRRYSALTQINRQNVTNLQVAWTYKSLDASNNLQCNPIIVGRVMFAPTPGKAIVAVDAAKGTELWRFQPEGRPAFRGLVYWPGSSQANAGPAHLLLRRPIPLCPRSKDRPAHVQFRRSRQSAASRADRRRLWRRHRSSRLLRPHPGGPRFYQGCLGLRHDYGRAFMDVPHGAAPG